MSHRNLRILDLPKLDRMRLSYIRGMVHFYLLLPKRRDAILGSIEWGLTRIRHYLIRRP